MEIRELIADEPVTLLDGTDKEINTGLTPEQLLCKIAYSGENVLYGADKYLVARAFYKACSKDPLLALLPGYKMWHQRYQSGYWTEEQFKRRIGTKDPLKEGSPLRDAYDILENLMQKEGE